MRGPLQPSDLRRLPLSQLTALVRQMHAVDPAILRTLSRDRRRGVRALLARLQLRVARVRREQARIESLYVTERDRRATGFDVIAGVDEAGVAPLAGPVVAGAVILPDDVDLPGLDDSKRLDSRERAVLYERICRVAVAVCTGIAAVGEIDRFNILQATRLAHRRAIAGLGIRPHLVMLDGRIPADVPVAQLVIIDGDATCASIAAASIIAKVTRDRMMAELGDRYPGYGFAEHKGYSTKAHREAIARLGLTPIHRRSFVHVKQQLIAIG
jgi:ribonuclease HII